MSQLGRPLNIVGDAVGEFGIAIRWWLENPDYRSARILLLPIDGTFLIDSGRGYLPIWDR